MHSFKQLALQNRRLLALGLLALPCAAGLGPIASAQTTPSVVQPQGTTQGQVPAGAGTVASAERADFAIQIGETFRLRHEQLGLIKEVVASRPGVVDLSSDPRDPTSVMVRGVNVGVTQLSISATDRMGNALAPTIKTVQVNPDISYIRSKVAETFPTANLKIVAGGPPGSLIVTGTVESAEDIDPIRTFINGIVSQYRGGSTAGELVTYAIRVAGPHVVQLDVCLASVNRREIRNLGVDFFHRDARSFLGTTISGASSGAASPGVLPVTGDANFTFGTTEGNSTFLGFINALREERMGKVLTNPTLVCLSGRPSRFLSGSEEPFGTAGGIGGGAGSGIQFRPVGTNITFLPVVIGDGKIRLTVAAEISQKTETITQPNFTAPVIAAQNIGTTVELENGQSLVIGGLVSNIVSGSTKKFPLLGDLPLVGTAFRTVSFDEQEEELVIIVKVSLVEPLDSHQRSLLKLPGLESRSPTDFELFLEGILEAPRGPRDPFPGRVYVPAYKLDEPFGARSGECVLPGSVCGDKSGRGGNGCAPCGTAVHPHGHAAIPTMTMPALQQTQQVVTPEPMPIPSGTPVAEPVKSEAEPPAVPVVPVVPAVETPVPPLPPKESKPEGATPVPPVPPQPN
jgi:pilus assembly protein CpaC